MENETILLTALLGGLIGSIITVIVQICIECKKYDNENKALIKALKTEILELEHLFIAEFTNKFSDKDETYQFYYPVMSDYFMIYHSNCSKIGRIKNDKLRHTIIALYSTATYLIDCLKSNNACIDEYNEAINKYGNDTTNENVKNALESLIYSKKENLTPAMMKLRALLDEFKIISCKQNKIKEGKGVITKLLQLCSKFKRRSN